MNNLIGHLFYLLLLAAALLAAPRALWDAQAAQYLFAIGVLASWRYAWALVNWLRFLLYTKWVYPHWRRKADAAGVAALPSEVYLLVTSYRIGAETTRRVYASVIAEASNATMPVTVVASIVEMADQRLIKQLWEILAPPEHVRLIFVRIAGTGKRDALACGFRSISRQMPAEDAVVAVVDGDTVLEPGLIARAAPFFATMPEVAALTTDEVAEVEGGALFRQWYALRFAQRHVYMGSCSLSKRVLTLTGRMSMFRASLVTDSAFIDRIERDYIDHWRLGRFRFLTGDDKSSWFHLLAAGHAMIYLPDVRVVTIETPPHQRFIPASIMLMRRWTGNTLRTSSRAIALGPKRMGWFPWIAIIDQRISMWTSLTGPVIALLAGLLVTPLALVYYLLWIALTRYLITLSLLAARAQVSALYPALLFYNQLLGAWVKIMVLFRLDKQKWTRQNTVLALGHGAWRQRALAFSSTAMHALALVAFVAALGSLTGILPMPDWALWRTIF